MPDRDWDHRLQSAERIDKQFVICPICRKPVDFFERYYDPLVGTTRFTIACHQKDWHLDIPDEVLAQASSSDSVRALIHFKLTRMMIPETFRDAQDGPYVAPANGIPEQKKPKPTRKITFE